MVVAARERLTSLNKTNQTFDLLATSGGKQQQQQWILNRP
jgi:hypothetical protein